MSSVPAPLIFSHLPTELLRDIFEHAAADDRASARSLALVSSAVRRWTEPALYHTVVLPTAPAVRAFLRALSARPADFARTRVKHLGIFALGPVNSIDKIVDACTGAQSLACGFSMPGYKKARGEAAPHSLVSREQHLLGMSCRDGWDSALLGPDVTHLRVHLASSCSSPDPLGLATDAGADASAWDSLAGLPSLTHLAVVHHPTASAPVLSLLPTLQRLLAPNSASAPPTGPPHLQFILVQVLGAGSDTAAEALNDAAVAARGQSLRIVGECAPMSVVKQWEQSVRAGPGVWAGAEAVVGKRLEAARKAEVASA